MSVLEYELRCAKRYRRFVTLVTVRRHEHSEADQNYLMRLGRDCDFCVAVNGSFFVLMPETTPEAARQALARYLNLSDTAKDRVQISITSFPEDGATAAGLLQTGLRRVGQAARG